MANVFNSENKTWIIDTASSSAIVDSQDLRVSSIRWVGGTSSSAGDHATITDPPTGNVIWDSIATGVDWLDLDNAKRRWPNGFKVTVLGHGILYILLE